VSDLNHRHACACPATLPPICAGGSVEVATGSATDDVGTPPISLPAAFAPATAFPGAATGSGLPGVWVESADIEPEVQGSDHCPVWVSLQVDWPTADCRRGEQEATPAATGGLPWYPIHSASINVSDRFKAVQHRLHAFFSAGQPPSRSPPADGGDTAVVGSLPSKAVERSDVPTATTQTVAAAKARGSGSGRVDLRQFFHGAPPAPPPTALGRLTPAASAPSSAARSVVSLVDVVSEADVDVDVEVEVEVELEIDGDAASRSAVSAVSPAVETTHAQSGTGSRGNGNTSGAWAAMLAGPPPAPQCRCGLAMVERTVKKGGTNAGRRFWVCPKPDGKAGDPKARCEVGFVWHDEWHREWHGSGRTIAAPRKWGWAGGGGGGGGVGVKRTRSDGGDGGTGSGSGRGGDGRELKARWELGGGEAGGGS